MEENTKPQTNTNPQSPPTPPQETDKKVADTSTPSESTDETSAPTPPPAASSDATTQSDTASEDVDDSKSSEEKDNPVVGVARSGMKVHPPASNPSKADTSAPAPEAEQSKTQESPAQTPEKSTPTPQMGSALQSSITDTSVKQPAPPTAEKKEVAPPPPKPHQQEEVKDSVQQNQPHSEKPAQTKSSGISSYSATQNDPVTPTKETEPAPKEPTIQREMNPFPTTPPPASAPPTPPPSRPTMSAMPANPLENPGPTKGPKAYLVEYLLSLVMTGALVGIVISFFSSIVNSIGASGAGGGWAARFAYTSSLATLSASIVFVVALFLVSKRCRKSEEAMPAIKHNKWRKGFLAIFLVLVGISALTAATTMVYNIVSLIGSVGVVSIEIGDTARSIINSIFAFAVLASTLMLYAQDYRISTMNPRLERLHHWGLIVGVIGLGIVFMALPLRNHRDAYIDGIASSDIRILQRAVDDHARSENELPSNLRSLDVGDDIDGRVDNYEYIESDDGNTYELCADFRTDTTGESSGGNPLEDALVGSGFGMTPSRDNNPDYHEDGRVCFEYEAPITSSPGFGSDDLDDEWSEFFQ